MFTAPRHDASTSARLLEDFSLEMTGKNVPELHAARTLIPPGTRVNVTYLAHEDQETRVMATRTARELGFVPVPHVSARRVPSRQHLDGLLSALRANGGTEHLFLVAGDPSRPEGPYDDTLSLLASDVLVKHQIRHVGVAGYPEGHPDIATPVLWDALERKVAALRELGLEGSVITQFGFDADVVVRWVEEVRARGVDLPIRVGVPGPAGVKRLLGYAKRFGVGTSAGVARKYGLSLTNLMSSAGPDRFLAELAEQYDANRHGEVKVHLFAFGGLVATAEWVARAKAAT